MRNPLIPQSLEVYQKSSAFMNTWIVWATGSMKEKIRFSISKKPI